MTFPFKKTTSKGANKLVFLPDSPDLQEVLLVAVGPDHIGGAGVVHPGYLREQAVACTLLATMLSLF